MSILKHLPRFRAAYRALDAFAEREVWSRSRLDAYQLERVNALWRHATVHVPLYRALAAHLPAEFSSLDEYKACVPVLPKEFVKTRPRELLSDRRRPGRWRFTGGSTGSTTGVYWGHGAHREHLQAKYRMAQAWGVDVFDPTVYLWGHAASFAPGVRGRLNRFRQPLEDRLRNRLRLSAYDLSDACLNAHLASCQRFAPRVLYAYSSAAELLARAAEARGAGLDSLRLSILTAEPAYPHMVETIERAFGAPAIREYGSVECGVLATEWPDRTLRVREDLVMLETVPRPDGRWDVIVTVLNNPSFPLLRYEIDDVAESCVVRPTAGFAAVEGVVGRVSDLVETRTGSRLHHTWFEHLFANTAGVRRWQVHQQSDGALRVSIESDAQGTPVDVRWLEQRIRRQTEQLPVTVRIVDRLAQNAAGKHRWLASDRVGRRGA